MAERDEARESPNVRQLIDRYLEEHAVKLAKRNRDDQGSMLRKLVEPELYELPVLSYQEMTQEINIQPLARIDL